MRHVLDPAGQQNRKERSTEEVPESDKIKQNLETEKHMQTEATKPRIDADTITDLKKSLLAVPL